MQKVVGAIRQQLVLQIDRHFVQREILIRSEGRVKYLTLTKQHQLAAAGMAAAFLVWASVSTVGGGIAGWLASSRGAEAERLEQDLTRIEGQVMDLQERFVSVSHDLSLNQQYVLDLIHSSEGGDLPALASATPFVADPAGELPDVEAVIAAINGDLNRLSSNNFVLSKEVSQARIKISTAADAQVRTRLARDRYRIALQQNRRQLARAESAGQALKSQVADLQLRVGALLTTQAAKVADNARLRGQLTQLSSVLNDIQGENDRMQALVTGMQRTTVASAQDRIALRAVRDELLSRVRTLENRLNTVSSTQNSIVEKLTERTRVGVNEIEKTVAMTGLKVDALLNVAGAQLSGEGGPFIAPRTYPHSSEEKFVLAAIENLDGEVERWERLQLVLRSLPLTAPLDSYAIRSGFGVRKDPISGRAGMHEGLDLSNDIGTPVLATAPGKVVYAGWMGDYGRMIEIDHGLGIRTRYGHLKKISVKVGDSVGYRDEIGLLGSSGRSTGPHLHYEVRVDDRPYDPINFLEAGKYVFKG